MGRIARLRRGVLLVGARGDSNDRALQFRRAEPFPRVWAPRSERAPAAAQDPLSERRLLRRSGGYLREQRSPGAEVGLEKVLKVMGVTP